MEDSVSRRLIIAEAERRGWRVDTFGPGGYFYVITDDRGRSEIFRGSRPARSSANGLLISKYKNLTADFVTTLGYEPLPYTIADDYAAAAAFMAAQGTVVVKPVDGGQSKGVTVAVSKAGQLRTALKLAHQYSPTSRAILQPHLDGGLYRLMVVDGKFVGAVLRKAAEVTGDGRRTVEALIKDKNRDPRRSTAATSILRPISLQSAVGFLGAGRLQSVPAKGESLRVCAIGSVSAGGEAVNVTDSVHPAWRQAAATIAARAGLFICGYDVICQDIAKPLPSPLPLLEINSMPGFKLLHYPTGGGDPIDLAAMLLDALFS